MPPCINGQLSDTPLVEEDAEASLAPARYLKNAAPTVPESIAAVEVRLHIYNVSTGLQRSYSPNA